MVGLSGGGIAVCGANHTQVEAWAGLEVGVGLWLTDFKLLVWGMQGITKMMGLLL